MNQKQRRAARHAAYNQGFRDAINARYADPRYKDDMYYMIGHADGWPQRLVETYIITPRGPVMEKCNLGRAAYLMTSNRCTPGGRR